MENDLVRNFATPTQLSIIAKAVDAYCEQYGITVPFASSSSSFTVRLISFGSACSSPTTLLRASRKVITISSSLA